MSHNVSFFQDDPLTPEAQLSNMQAALQQLRAEALSVARFSSLVQEQSLLRSALPGRFDEVLMQLLDRLESSALFSDESCSFSHSELLGSLQLWAEKALLQLDKR
ncbi:MAG: hypothetical protein ABIV07_07845 [Polaromonas sp.]